MDYIEYHFKVTPLQPATDILIAELGAAGFESFEETDHGVLAYIQKIDWHTDVLNDVTILENQNFKIEYTYKEIAQENWNETWEKNFNPIIVDDKCVVRAPFHQKFDVTYDIVIAPKMSFGTGHHETTYMMLQYILNNNWENKKVLDMGCGTAVLAILAKMKGATHVDAIDIDNWCYINSIENIERNHCQSINVYEGDASLLSGKVYDTIIANINRNILIDDMEVYSQSLSPKGELYLSGFYAEDLPMIQEECTKHGLKFVSQLERNKWVAAKFVKK